MSTLHEEIEAWLSPKSNDLYKQEYEAAQTLLDLRFLIALRAACQHESPSEKQRLLAELITEARLTIA
jgi:hypothetical protein